MTKDGWTRPTLIVFRCFYCGTDENINAAPGVVVAVGESRPCPKCGHATLARGLIIPPVVGGDQDAN